MGFTLTTGKQFVAQQITRPPFVVDELVPAQALTILYGPPSVGKSTMLWTMADAVCQGIPFLGNFPTSKGTSLLVNADMPEAILQDRFNKGGYEPLFDLANFPNHFNITKLQVDEPLEWAKLQAAATAYTLVMIDNLSTITNGMSVKEDWVPGLVVSALRSLFPTQAIVLLHHSRKQVMTPHGPLPPHREDDLGSQFWKAMCQSELQLFLKRGDMAHLRVVKSQVSGLGLDDGIDVFVDSNGCVVSAWTENDAKQKAQALLTAEQTLLRLDPSYRNKKLTGAGGRYELLAAHLNTKPSTLRRWISRSQYQML